MKTPATFEIPYPEVGDKIEAVVGLDGQQLVVPKRISDNLGLDWSAQHRNLTTSYAHWSRMVEMPILDAKGARQNTCVMPFDRVPMWLVKITPSKVRPELREKIKRYQCEAADVLGRYFAGQSPADPVIEPERSLIERVAALEGAMKKLGRSLHNLQVPSAADIPPGYLTLRQYVNKHSIWIPKGSGTYQGQVVSRISRRLRLFPVKVGGPGGVDPNHYHPEPLEEWAKVIRSEHPSWRQPRLAFAE